MRIKNRVEVRTTLTLDDRLVERIRDLAAQEGLTISAIVNRSLRQAILPTAARAPREVYRVLGFTGDNPSGLDLLPAAVGELRDLGTG